MISEAKLIRTEQWLTRYEAGGVFFARLLPVVRHLISIPAGIVRMNFITFSAMTLVGSALWCGVLAWFGQTAITPEMLRDPAGMALALKAKSHLIVAAVLVLCVMYFLVMRLTKPRSGAEQNK
jgi:membrane protein DedA with SNARE-associated domain